MKKTIKLILAIVIVLMANGAYFEYCVSRGSPMLILLLSTIAITIVNMVAFVQLTKTISKALKIKE